MTVRGQHTWYGMGADQNRGFEVGESTSFTDFIKTKLRKQQENPAVANSQNMNIYQFVE